MDNLNQPVRVRLGNLDRRATIRQQTATRDETGGETLTWSDLATVWARLEYPAAGSGERYMTEQQTSYTRVVFTIRHRTDILPKMQIRYNSKDYDILTAEEIGRANYLKIVTELLQ